MRHPVPGATPLGGRALPLNTGTQDPGTIGARLAETGFQPNPMLAAVQAKVAGQQLHQREQRSNPPVYRTQPAAAAQRQPARVGAPHGNMQRKSPGTVTAPATGTGFQPNRMLAAVQAKIASQHLQRGGLRTPPPVYKPKAETTLQRQPNGLWTLEKRRGQLAALPNIRIMATAHAIQPASVVQRGAVWDWLCSCWSRPTPQRNEDEDSDELLPSATTTIAIAETRHDFLMQGQGTVSGTGNQVTNLGVTSCGLVLGFGATGIAAYHWPFMTNATRYFNEFDNYRARIGELRRIEIYTNPVSSQTEYEKTTRAIREEYGVPTVHYIYGNSLRGVDVTVTLGPNSTTVVDPAVTSTFLSL